MRTCELPDCDRKQDIPQQNRRRPTSDNQTFHRWLPTDDDIYGSLFGPQALAARMFGRLNPHWYLNGGDER